MVLFPYLGILGGPVRHGVHGSVLQVRGTYSPGEIWGHFGTIVTSGSNVARCLSVASRLPKAPVNGSKTLNHCDLALGPGT